MPLSKIVAKSITDDTITTDQIADTSVHGRRNLFINGAMQVAQRGTSITGVGIDDYALDRWKQWASSGSETGRSTITQETITDLAGFSKAMKIQVTTADTSLGSTDALAMMQRIEAQNILQFGIGTSNSKTLTLSVYAKAPTGNGTYCMGIAMPGGGHYVEEITVGTSWSRHEINIPATTTSSHATTATGTSNGMQAFIALCAGSARNTATNGAWGSGANIIGTTNQSNFYSSTSNNLWLTGWQLEVGDKATPFEHRSYSEELESCKRYFQKVNDVWFNANRHGDDNWDGHIPAGHHEFHPEMRAAPSASNVDIDGWLDNTNSWTSTATTAASPTGMTSKKVNFTGVWNWHGNYNDTHAFRIYTAEYDAEL